MKLRNKTIRVFLSSTFEDLKMERDALQQKAFRNLREYCREKGWQFQAVDLRWGINNEATIDQRTMEICLREIARCQEQSPRPNFIVLLGERYGWRPLPDRVLQNVEVKMKPEMPAEIQSLFRQWYELDENQLPEPVWKLRAREGRYIDYNEYEKTIQKPMVAFFTRWSAENLPDPELPENKTNPLALQRLSMERSATEQEIQAGAFGVEDAREHVFAFFRNIPDCPKENATWHDTDQHPVQRLRSHLKSYLHEDNISEFSAGWDKEKNQPDTAHLEKLSNDVEICLKAIIDREIENYELASEHELEQAAHEAFASERTFGFSGRENDIAAICEYAKQTNNTPFVVWGESGTGKSTLMAMAAHKVQETLPHAHVITRFIGVTGKSANGYTLLADICRNLCQLYGGEPAEIPEDPAKLQYAFREYLAKATDEHPLVLFLDALDQLNDGDPARLLQWLPEVLPANVKVILSTLKGVSFDVLKERKEPAPFFYEITPLTATDGRNALSAWLKRANRTLQAHQTAQIIRDFEYAGCAPLYLHLAFEQAQHWESYARRQRLGRDIPEMIEEFYSNLSRPEAHGSIVEKVLTAIRCAKQGLSDDEILGVLAADDEFWNSFGIQTYHTYDDGEKTTTTSRLIPPVLWIRLYHDLEYYLTRRNAPGGEVITFYHRQLAEAVDNMYLQRPGLRQKRHKELAGFFAGKRLLIKETAPLIANVRVCDELPWLLTKGEDWDALTDTLCNLDFIQAKAAAKMTYELVSDFNAALEVIPDNAENIRKEKERQARMDKYTQDLIACAKGEISRFEIEVPESIIPWTQEKIDAEIERIKNNPNHSDRLRDFKNFLGQEASNLQNHANEFPYFANQQAWNYAKDGPVGANAEKISSKIRKHLFLRIHSTRPFWSPLPQIIQILKGHTSGVWAISMNPDGQRAISGSDDKTCILWDLNIGKVIHVLIGHTSCVNAVAITPDYKRAISGSNDSTCILWDMNIGSVIRVLVGHTSSVKAVAITPDFQRAISGSVDNTCILWDLKTGKAIHKLIGHTLMVNAVAITPDGKLAISGSNDKTCILWNLETGKEIKIFEHNSDVTAVAITPDGLYSISGSWEKICIWDIKLGEAINTIKGNNSGFSSIDITPNGKLIISGSWDSTCSIWDVNTGIAIKKLVKHSNSQNTSVRSVSITPDGQQAISSYIDKSCIHWNLNSKEEKIVLKQHNSMVWEVSISSDSQRAISVSLEKTILWDLNTGQIIQLLKGYSFRKLVAIAPDGQRAIGQLVNSIVDKDLMFYYLKTGEVIQVLNGYNDSVFAICFTPDGKRAISSSNSKIILWNLNTGKEIYVLKGHNSMVYHIAISPDGRKAISVSEDNTCKIWNLKSNEEIYTFKGHTSYVNTVCFSSDGHLAISGSHDKTFILWDIVNQKQLVRQIVDYEITSIASKKNVILLGCSSGEVILINVDRKLICPGTQIVTIKQIWNQELYQYQWSLIDCPNCGYRFTPPQKVVETIEEITKKAGLRPDQSPCLELPDEAWEEPGLLASCPKCGEALKFNPFVAGGE